MRIFTDASTSQNVSGIAFFAIDKSHNVLSSNSKAVLESDNNTAELLAVMYALEEMEPKEPVVIITDSTYAISVIRSGRCRRSEIPILSRIQEKLSGVIHSMFWIKGHRDDGTYITKFNRESDHLAKQARKEFIIRRRREKYMRNKLKNKGGNEL